MNPVSSGGRQPDVAPRHEGYEDNRFAGTEIYELQSLSRVVSTIKLAPDWLHKSEQPIRSQANMLTQLLTTTQKFPLQMAGIKAGDALISVNNNNVSR